MDSILTSIKKILGITEDYHHFDSDLIVHINSVFSILTQLGVGPANGFSILDENDTWDDFITDRSTIEMIKSYMALKVRLMFDPPLSSSVTDSFNRLVNEFEWRLNVAVDPKDERATTD